MDIKDLNVLLVAMIHPFGDTSKDFTYEYYNFYQCLKRLVKSVSKSAIPVSLVISI